MSALLDVRDLRAGYGGPEILHGVDIGVGAGDIVGVIGANGAGKSTLVRAIAGTISAVHGEIRLNGIDLTESSTVGRIGRGLGVVPDGHGVWPTLTVSENLRVGALGVVRRERLDRQARLLEVFPRLRERMSARASNLSGGERKMLAVARAMMRDPAVLILDEPSVGLSPMLVSQLLSSLRQYVDASPTARAVLLVEQNVAALARVADRIHGLYLGSIVAEFSEPAKLLTPEGIEEAFRLSYAGEG